MVLPLLSHSRVAFNYLLKQAPSLQAITQPVVVSSLIFPYLVFSLRSPSSRLASLVLALRWRRGAAFSASPAVQAGGVWNEGTVFKLHPLPDAVAEIRQRRKARGGQRDGRRARLEV